MSTLVYKPSKAAQQREALRRDWAVRFEQWLSDWASVFVGKDFNPAMASTAQPVNTAQQLAMIGVHLSSDCRDYKYKLMLRDICLDTFPGFVTTSKL